MNNQNHARRSIHGYAKRMTHFNAVSMNENFLMEAKNNEIYFKEIISCQSNVQAVQTKENHFKGGKIDETNLN